jgi:hypothetical protein
MAASRLFGPRQTLSSAPQSSKAGISSKKSLSAAYEILGGAAIVLAASEINRRILWLKISHSGVRRQRG